MFQLTEPQRESANPLFRPTATTYEAVAAIPPTSVLVTTVGGVEVDLVATLAPASPVANGVQRVAGVQTIYATVPIDFSDALPLWWMASAVLIGQVAPNEGYSRYLGPSDNFSLTLTPEITLSYNSGKWTIPAFDSTKYKVDVGFGVGADWVCWAYSVAGSPRSSVSLQTSAYELVKSDGIERIGDPVNTRLDHWVMQLGSSYTLAFDASGNGVLTKVS